MKLINTFRLSVPLTLIVVVACQSGTPPPVKPTSPPAATPTSTLEAAATVTRQGAPGSPSGPLATATASPQAGGTPAPGNTAPTAEQSSADISDPLFIESLRRHRDNPPPTPALRPIATQALLEPMTHEWQKLNNCAPVTIGMALSYYGKSLTQFDIAPAVKGGPQDKNVSPWEVADYLRGQGLGAIVRVNGDLETLQRLVSNGIPVMVEQWLDRPNETLTGHYRLVRGYDRAAQAMIVNDSYMGPKRRFAYAEFNRLWRAFNRLYIPIYRLEDEPRVRAILGDGWNDERMDSGAAVGAQAEVVSVGDAYAWFNLGSSYIGLGQYELAAAAFDRAIRIGLPPRMFWYQFGTFEAYNRTGQYQKVLNLTVLLTGLALEEVHYQRGLAYEGLGQPQLALAEYEQALKYNARLARAAAAIQALGNVGNGGARGPRDAGPGSGQT